MDATPHNEQTDSRLIESVAGGDAQAMRQIVELHQAMVYRTCLRLLRNEADAEDATQATFIVFHKKCRKLKRGTVLGGWLYRTAGFISREFIRSSARRKHREEEAAAMNKSAAQETVETWNALQPELDGAIILLPAKYREVVVLRYLEGKSTSQTAGILGVSDSAVTTRLNRALEQLRALLGRRGIALGAGALSVVLAENATMASVPAGLGSSILNATGHAAIAAAGSANVGVMVKGALAKTGFIALQVWNVFIFIAWVECMISWVTRGCPIPRWVHILAACLLAVGIASVAFLGATGGLTLKFAVTWIIMPPVAAYVGWLWMFGPAHATK